MNNLFPRRFKQLRIEKKMSQEVIGSALGVTKGTISVWERGLRIPHYQNILQIADFFGVSQAYLLGMDEESPNAGESYLTELIHSIPSLSPRAQQMAENFIEYLLEQEGVGSLIEKQGGDEDAIARSELNRP